MYDFTETKRENQISALDKCKKESNLKENKVSLKESFCVVW